MWNDRRFIDLVGIEHPIIQAPMAGPNGFALAIAVAQAGGLGSLPCAMLSPGQIRAELNLIRQQTAAPYNVNFFCHAPPVPDAKREAGWKARLRDYYVELGLDPDAPAPGAARALRCQRACADAGVPPQGRELPFRAARRTINR